MKLEKNKIISELAKVSKVNLKHKVPTVLCYTTKIKSENFYNIIDKKSSEFPDKIFWEKELHNMSFLALGTELILDNKKYLKKI